MSSGFPPHKQIFWHEQILISIHYSFSASPARSVPSLSLSHTLTHKWMNTSVYTTSISAPAGFGRRASFGATALTWRAWGWSWISCEKVWTQGQGKDGLCFGILSSYFYPYMSSPSLTGRAFTAGEMSCGCIFPLCHFECEKFTHTYSWTCCSSRL